MQPLTLSSTRLTCLSVLLYVQILSAHVVPTPILSSEVPEGDTELETLSGALLTVSAARHPSHLLFIFAGQAWTNCEQVWGETCEGGL